MTIAREIVSRAHRLLGKVTSGDALPESECQDGLTALNMLIESWQAEKLVVYAFVDTAFTMVADDASYTVGPSGNFALTPRPSKLENVYVRASDTDYGVEIVDSDRWVAIADKTVTSNIPSKAYYEPTLTTGTLQVWPVPDTGNSLHIVTWTAISTLALLTTAIALPSGYERALSYNLAVDLGPELSVNPPAAVVQIAADSKATIMRANHRPMISYTELVGLTGRRSDIYSGGYV